MGPPGHPNAERSGRYRHHTFTHDLLGRVLTLDGPWSGDSDKLTWTYNDAARQVTRTASGAEGTYSETTTADTLERLASVVNPLGTFTMAYSGNTSRATAITHSGGFDTTFTYTGPIQGYALAGILSKIPGGATVAQHSYTYDNLGQIATWKREAPLANPGTTHQYEWTLAHDYSGQLTSVIEKSLAGSLLDGWAFGYDAAGNRQSATRSGAPGTTSQAMTATHNPMNQITMLGGGGRTFVAGSLNEPGQVAVGIAGQGDKPARMLPGNRFETELDLPAGTSTLQITGTDPTGNTSQKQYTVATAPQTARSFAHDADGNLTSDGVRTYEWDAWSRLTKITWATGKTTDISYNALGQRSKLVHTDSGTTRTEYLLYDGAELLQRRTGGTAANNTDTVYFAQGERRKTGSMWSNHHYTRDHLGTVREVLASDGGLLARYDYTPYGERETRYEASGYEGTDFGFTGHITLKSPVAGQQDLLLAHFRAYDPVIGRWLGQDPIREAGGVNLYGYVGGAVVMNYDLLGLEGWEYDSQGYHWYRDRQPGADSYVLEFNDEGKPTFKPKPGHSFPGKDWCESHFNEQMKNPEWKAQRRKDIATLFDDPSLTNKSRATKLGRGLRQFGKNGGNVASLVGLLFMFSNHEAEAAETAALVRRWLNQPKGNGAALGAKIGGLMGLGDAGTTILIFELEAVEDCP